jgi:SynChlorMet cassette protein ScmC
MCVILPDILPIQTLHLHLGPLTYLLQAHDSWGESVLVDIARHINSPIMEGTPDRIIHLANDAPPAHISVAGGQLPAQFKKYLPEGQADSGWSVQQNRINCIWQSQHSPHTFWTATAASSLGNIRFHLPWGLIISDMVNHGGGLIHCGLACYQDSGLLFLAPPSGGKSTTMSSAPEDWQALSDDAALVWPDDKGSWHASPLPAWGNMIQPENKWLYRDMSLSRCCHLKGLMLLEKAHSINLQTLAPSTTLPSVYQALCEYPATITAEALQQQAFFHSAAAISRTLPAWQLSLPLHGNVWPLLTEKAL